MTRSGFSALVGAAVMMFASQASAAIFASACGSLPLVNTVHSTTSQTGSATGFAPVAGSLVNFVVGGAAPSCVIVTFSAQARAQNFDPPPPGGIIVPGLMWVRAVLVNSGQSVDGQIAFAAEDGGFAQSHSYSFLFQSVAPGARKVFLQYRSNTSGAPVTIDRFAVDVQHR